MACSIGGESNYRACLVRTALLLAIASLCVGTAYADEDTDRPARPETDEME